MIYRCSPDHQPSTPEKKRASHRKWTAANRKHINALARKYRKRKSLDYGWVQRNRDRNKAEAKALRLAALTAYGGAQCACDHDGKSCGQHPPEFLSIDHINGDNKKQQARGGHTLYRQLRKQGYPVGYRVLCHNCNCALGFYGYCPLSKNERQRRKVNAARNIAGGGVVDRLESGLDCEPVSHHRAPESPSL